LPLELSTLDWVHSVMWQDCQTRSGYLIDSVLDVTSVVINAEGLQGRHY